MTATAALVSVLVAAGALWAGHEVSYYPAFYPNLVTLSTLDPQAAGKALIANKLHVYLGGPARFASAPPESVRHATSVGGYVLVTLNPAATGLGTPAARCKAAEDILGTLAAPGASGFVFHPYPITPFHEDYAAHADRAAHARRQAEGGASSSRARQAIQAGGTVAKQLTQGGWTVTEERAPSGIAVIEVPQEQVLAPTGMGSWAGPPWLKEGWYEAWRLLGTDADPGTLAKAKPLVTRLMRGDFDGRVQAYNLERDLVAALTAPCTRVAAGYTLRQESYNTEYTFGIEYIAPDSALGLNNPVFLRTVKLKDFPWNGSLVVGMDAAPKAGWNPVAGFGDPAGRVVWSLIADDAFMSLPDSEGWQANRIDAQKSAVRQFRSAQIPVPPDALAPEPGTGILKPVGPGKMSRALVGYRILASPFLDGQDTDVEDLLYPFALAFRWGSGVGDRRDPAIAAQTALLRERLVAVRIGKSERSVDNMGGVEVPRVAHLIEVYLDHGALDQQQVAALAPPWSAVPWQLLVLQEEAVGRGLAAFSEEEAKRRGIPWLDLARDPRQLEQLRKLLEELKAGSFRSPALASGALAALVTPEIAAKRWIALAAFAKDHGHLLDTNGPYVIKNVEPGKVGFEVVRDFRYAVGLGSFNLLADAPSARVTELRRKGRQVEYVAELEVAEHIQRNLVVSRSPFKKNSARGFKAVVPRSQLVVIGPDGRVVDVRHPKWQDDGRFAVTLPASLPKGKHTVTAAVYADENTARAGTRTLTFEVR